MPTVGCPANGISLAGVKMRTRAVCARLLRLQHEHGLGQVELARDRLHARAVQPVGVEHDGQRIAGEARVGEDVEDVELQLHRALLPAWSGAHIAGFPADFQAAGSGAQLKSRERRCSAQLNFVLPNISSLFTSFAGHRMAPLSPALAALIRACPKPLRPRTWCCSQVLRRRGADVALVESGRARWKARNPVGAAGTPRVSAALAFVNCQPTAAERSSSNKRLS